MLLKRLNRREEKEKVEEREEVAAIVAVVEGETEVAAVGVPYITIGIYNVVAEVVDVVEEIVAGVDSMSVGSEEDEDEIVNGTIVVRLPGERKRRITEAGGEERVGVKENGLVRAIPVGPGSGEQKAVASGRVPSRPSSMFAGRGRGGMEKGFRFG